MGGGESTIAATDRSLAILEVVADAPEPMGVTAVADRTSLTKGTVHKHLATLRARGYVRNVDGRYAPAVGLVDLGIRASRETDLIAAAVEPVDELAEMTAEVAGLVLGRDGRLVDAYVATANADPSFPAYNTRHLHCSAAGKAILAAYDPAAAEELLAATSLPALTDHTITEEGALLAELGRIRDRGVAFDLREQFPRVNGVAVGFTADDGAAAVYVSGWADELSGKRFEENLPGLLFSASRMIRANAQG